MAKKPDLNPKIVFAVTTDLNHDQRMQRTASSLFKAGYQVKLIGRLLASSQPLAPTPYDQDRLKLPVNKGKIFYLLFNLRLLFYLLKEPASILVAVDFDTLLGTRLAGWLKHKPTVLDAHEYFTEVPELRDRPLSKYIWDLQGRCLIPGLAAAYTVNQSLARILGTTYRKKFQVVRNLPERQKIKQVPKRDFILYQGALNEGRGLFTLIKATPHLPLPLYLAGDGDLRPELERLTSSLGLEEQVFFLGSLSPEELREMTPKAFLGYNLLESSSRNYYYSLANKFFDYLHAGIPSLSNPFPEYARITSLYNVAALISLDMDSIIQAVWDLWNSPERYQQMVEACYQAKNVYCWETEEKALLSIYNSVLEAHDGAG